MEDKEISHSFWTLLTWILAVLSWTVDHIGAIAGIAAVAASFFSVRASRATERLRVQEQRALEDEIRTRTPPTSKGDSKDTGPTLK